MLAVEAGAVNYVENHPDFPALVQQDNPACGCLPPLYHAAVQPFLYFLGVAQFPESGSALPSWRMVAVLLSLGVKPNIVVRGRLNDLDPPRTQWREFLSCSLWCASLSEDAKLQLADVAAMFLAAEADPTLEIPAWVVELLSDEANWDKLNTPRENLLRAIDLLAGKERGIVPAILDENVMPPTTIVEDPIVDTTHAALREELTPDETGWFEHCPLDYSALRGRGCQII
jgi:hypothetical protein